MSQQLQRGPQTSLRQRRQNSGNEEHQLSEPLLWFYLCMWPSRRLINSNPILPSNNSQQTAIMERL